MGCTTSDLTKTDLQPYVDSYDTVYQNIQDFPITIHGTDEQCIIDTCGCNPISNIGDFFEENKQTMDLCINPNGINNTGYGSGTFNTYEEYRQTIENVYVANKGNINSVFGSNDPGGHGRFLAWFNYLDSAASFGDYVLSKPSSEIGEYDDDARYRLTETPTVLLKFTKSDGTDIIFQYDTDDILSQHEETVFALSAIGTCNKPVDYVVFTPSEICLSDFNYYIHSEYTDYFFLATVEKTIEQKYCQSQCESRPANQRPVTRAIHADTKQAALLNGNLVEQIEDTLYVRGENGYNIPCTGSFTESFRVLSNGEILVVDGKTKLYNGQNVEKEFDGTQILAVAPDETSFLVGLTTDSGMTGIQLHFFDERSSITVSPNKGGIVSYSPDGDYFAVQKNGYVVTEHGSKKINTIFKLDGTQISQFYTDHGMTWGDDIIAQSATDMCSRYDINGNELGSFECPGFFYKTDAYKDFMVTYDNGPGYKRVTLYKDGTEIFATRENTNNANPYFKDDKLYFMDSDRDVLVEIDLSLYSTEPLPKETLIRTYQEHYCD